MTKTVKENKTDKSTKIFQRDKLKNKLNIRERVDLTDRQKEFLELAQKNNTRIVFLSGPAGSSKTFLAVLAALELINNKLVSDLIYVRSVVESSDHKMGYLPG